MTQSSSPFQSTRSPALPYGAATYKHPDDVTSDPSLTTAEKRAVLASWVSDARAVENAPSSRRLDSGAVVEVDAIRQALVSLDGLAPRRLTDRKPLPPGGRRYSAISKWLRRAEPPNRANDNDDDDPPPAPAGFGVPFRPKPLSPAYGARLERAAALACALG